MNHHLKIVIVLDVTALNQGQSPINNHELCVKCPKYWSMVVDDLEVDIGYLLQRWQLDFFANGLLLLNRQTIVAELSRISPIVYHLDNDSDPALSGSLGQFPKGVGHQGRCVRMDPEIGCQEDFCIRARDAVRHMTAEIGQRRYNGQGDGSMAAH